MSECHLLIGHVLDHLKDITDNSVDCIVTSPPFWQLRRYEIPDTVWPDGWIGQLGLEPTIQLYLEHLAMVFKELYRVLKPA